MSIITSLLLIKEDHFVGALKGKILSEYPQASIIDISHHIDPFNTVEASYIISAA
jgi:S-adenosylmethionine hydrolase